MPRNFTFAPSTISHNLSIAAGEKDFDNESDRLDLGDNEPLLGEPLLDLLGGNETTEGDEPLCSHSKDSEIVTLLLALKGSHRGGGGRLDCLLNTGGLGPTLLSIGDNEKGPLLGDNEPILQGEPPSYNLIYIMG